MAEQHVSLPTEDPNRTESLIEEFESEKPARKLSGEPKLIVSLAGLGLSCYALLWVFRPVPALRYRVSFLAVALFMTFLVYRACR